MRTDKKKINLGNALFVAFSVLLIIACIIILLGKYNDYIDQILKSK